MDKAFSTTVYQLAKRAEECVSRNNAIDMFEEYFCNIEEDHSSEPPNAKTITIFKDPNSRNPRPVSKLSWHPDSHNKIGVAHSSLEFQGMNEDTPLQSYIWDVNNPNRPDFILEPQSQLCTLAFNRKSPEHIIGGCYNGIIGLLKYKTNFTSLLYFVCV